MLDIIYENYNIATVIIVNTKHIMVGFLYGTAEMCETRRTLET
jgi:hypothetical protein